MGEVRQEPSYLAIQYLHEAKKYSVSKLCAALHIPRCSYYKWLKREKNRNLICSIKQLRRILMHILYSIVTVDSSIQVSTFGQSWTVY